MLKYVIPLADSNLFRNFVSEIRNSSDNNKKKQLYDYDKKSI